MAYVTVPKDLTKIKSKTLFGLTKRQLVCFGSAALVGVPLFFLSKGSMGTTSAALCMILVMLPFFLFALYEKNGQTLEVILGHLIQCKFIRPKRRIYQTNNAYSALVRQAKLEKEVRAIAEKNGKTGKLLAGAVGETWVQPINVYFHALYNSAVDKCAQLLYPMGKFSEIITLCERATMLDQSDEKMHANLIRAFVAMGDYERAAKQYDYIRAYLMEQYGAAPGAHLTELYEPTRFLQGKSLPAGEAAV